MSVLAADNLDIGYGDQRVASNISLRLQAGSVTCLLGPNGCGKTTLFKTLIGLIPPLRGEVTVDGDLLGRLSAAERARRIAYVPQAHAPPFPFTVEDVVMMGRQARLPLFSAPGADDRARVRAALEKLGIEALAEADYSRLSGGQRQMVLIARALVQETKALVLDEPTASLDYGNQVLILAEIARLAADGFAVLLSTHNPDHAFAVGDHVMLMHEGAIVSAGPPRQTLTSQTLETVYGVPIAVETLSDGTTVCAPRIGGISRPRAVSRLPE